MIPPQLPENAVPSASTVATTPQRSTVRWPILACLLALTALPGLCAHAAGSTSSDRFIAATQVFETARAGSADATPQAEAAFHQLLAADPGNPLYMAYYGSTLALQARDSHLPWQRINLVRECIAHLDRALTLLKPTDDQRRVRDVPVSLETRLVAIATYVALPEIFHRLPVAKQQLAIAMASPVFATSPSELRGRYYYEVALVAQLEGQTDGERTALRQVLQLAPASLDLNEVRLRLARLGTDSNPAVAVGR
jgi:hypothetical protein